MKSPSRKLARTVTSAFSASLCPINAARNATFGLIERLCCVGLIAAAAMLMRLLFAK